MNFFIAPKQRTSEIHMPGYAPTASGIIGKGSFLPFGPLQVLRDGGRSDQEQLHDVGADDSGAGSATLPRRTTSAASTNTSWHGPHPTARSTRSGIWRRWCRRDLWKTTCYGKRLRTVRSLSDYPKMPADRGLRRYRGQPYRAGLPQAGPQAETPREPRPRGLRASGGQNACGVRRSCRRRKKARSINLRGFCMVAETHGLRSISSMPFRVPRAAGIVQQKEAGSSRTVAVQAQGRDSAHQLPANAGASISGQQKLFLATGFEVVGQFLRQNSRCSS